MKIRNAIKLMLVGIIILFNFSKVNSQTSNNSDIHQEKDGFVIVEAENVIGSNEYTGPTNSATPPPIPKCTSSVTLSGI